MKIQSIRGMPDILPPNSIGWQKAINTISDIVNRYDFNPIQTPIVENTSVFSRSVGDSSDVVTKEMYQFKDRSDNDICLRPEVTAGVVRSMLQHNLLAHNAIQRLYYHGPMFRYERPQKGRQRQFHQFGLEYFGSDSHHAELELLLINQEIWQAFGVENDLTLHINSLGSQEDRNKYKQLLQEYLQKYIKDLDEDSQRRLETNPLRIFDSKVEATQKIMQTAPKITTALSADSKQKMQNLENDLTAMGIDYIYDDGLVRGLDYYNNLVFEYKTNKLGAQGTVCAGGRYDNLTAQFGAKPCPAVGFAIGMERLMLLLETNNQPQPAIDIYIICSNNQAITIAQKLRQQLIAKQNIKVVIDYSQGSIKTQIKRANKSNAKIACFIAEEELQNNSISIKSMQDDSYPQQAIDYDKSVAAIYSVIN